VAALIRFLSTGEEHVSANNEDQHEQRSKTASIVCISYACVARGARFLRMPRYLDSESVGSRGHPFPAQCVPMECDRLEQHDIDRASSMDGSWMDAATLGFKQSAGIIVKRLERTNTKRTVLRTPTRLHPSYMEPGLQITEKRKNAPADDVNMERRHVF
jgi:hypothetical protein